MAAFSNNGWAPVALMEHYDIEEEGAGMDKVERVREQVEELKTMGYYLLDTIHIVENILDEEEEKEDSTDKLKPCPFCGKEVRIEIGGTHGYDLKMFIDCCVYMFGGYLTGNQEFDDGREDALINKWNKRS